jgi:hypothetical protein
MLFQSHSLQLWLTRYLPRDERERRVREVGEHELRGMRREDLATELLLEPA